jgi:hypothetical protein
MTKINIILELAQALTQYDQGEAVFTEMRANGTLNYSNYQRRKEDNADDFINAIRGLLKTIEKDETNI